MATKEKEQYKLFASNLRTHVDRWKNDHPGKTQADLAKRVGLQDRKSISNYLNAISYPEEYTMKRLCSELGTTPEELNAGTFEEKLKYDGNFTEKLHDGFQQFGEGIGLNEDFLKFVRSAIPDSDFPLWKRIYHPFDLNATGPSKYAYMEPYEAFHTDQRNYYQVTLENGKTVNLLYPDLAFLKDVQTEVIKYVEYLYFRRKQEMEEELNNINSKYVTDHSSITVSTAKLFSMTKYSEYMTEEKQHEVFLNLKDKK